jgi:hypothetical protein
MAGEELHQIIPAAPPPGASHEARMQQQLDMISSQVAQIGTIITELRDLPRIVTQLDDALRGGRDGKPGIFVRLDRQEEVGKDHEGRITDLEEALKSATEKRLNWFIAGLTAIGLGAVGVAIGEAVKHIISK